MRKRYTKYEIVQREKLVTHKQIWERPFCWAAACGNGGLVSPWLRNWKHVTCKRCLKKRPTTKKKQISSSCKGERPAAKAMSTLDEAIERAIWEKVCYGGLEYSQGSTSHIMALRAAQIGASLALREAAAAAQRERELYMKNGALCEQSGNHNGASGDAHGALACEGVAKAILALDSKEAGHDET